MGTSWSARIVSPPAAVEAAIAATLDEIVASMSHWEAGSALSRFNRSPIGAWQTLPPALRLVLDTARRIGAESGGAFDPAVGALADLWGFGPPGPRHDAPTDDEVAAALARSGVAAIERMGDRARRTRDVRLDLSGIAKGYAVDAVRHALEALGARDFLIEIGGEFVGRGVKPDGQPWWVALEDPPGLTPAPLRIALHGIAVATSGDYRRFIAAADGSRLGHTLDPRTGRPVADAVASVSVIAADCLTADGWATALTVLGSEAGMAVATEHRLAARIIDQTGTERISPALAEMLR